MFRKNQVVITALALMIAVAGYLNYSGQLFNRENGEEADMSNLALLDISEEEMTTETDGDIESPEENLLDVEEDSTPGAAVLTSNQAYETIAAAKISREQVRASSRETLQGLVDNESLSAEQKEAAVAEIIELTDLAETEVAIETLLQSKGFSDVAVTLSAESADIVVIREELTDANRAQIEDIVTRKSEIDTANIVISPIQTTE